MILNLAAMLFGFIGIILITFGILKIYKKKYLISQIFSTYNDTILQEHQKERQKQLQMFLDSSGVSLNEYRLMQILSLISGIVLAASPFLMNAGLFYKVIVLPIAVAIIISAPKLFLIEQRKKRIERIDNDLAIFLDLMVIILQAGGGLLNAITIVTKEAEGIIGKDLIEESKKFQSEITTLPSNLAYENLVTRTGSDNIASVVSYMRISEESGIGLKTIFENQAKEIKEKEFFEIEKKSAMINIKMILIVFFFILPAVGAFIILPMSDNALMPEMNTLLGSSQHKSSK